MKLCREGNDSPCGKTICCQMCADREDCNSVCEWVNDEDCPNIIDSDIVKLEDHIPEVLQDMSNLLLTKKTLEAEEKELKTKIKQAMEDFGIKKWNNDYFSVTYVEPTTRSSIDSKKLKKELPEVAEKYTKTSEVKGFIKVELK